MTRAPDNLLAVRRLLLDHLNVDPDTSRDQDLEPAEVGIVGDPAHRGGGHCGSDRVKRDQAGRITDYTVVESPRDRDGLTLDAAALDVGSFEVRAGGRTHDLRSFSVWCVAQCVAGTPDSRDIREIIYSPDGRTVRRWDRLGRRSTGDNSHLWHTHFTFFRDAIKAGRDQTPLFRRYLSTIGLITEDPMAALTDAEQRELLALARSIQHVTSVAGYRVEALVSGRPTYNNQMGDKAAPNVLAQRLTALGEAIARESSSPEEVRALLADLPAPPSAEAISEQVLVGLDPAGLAERIAAALPADQARQVADELARRLVG